MTKLKIKNMVCARCVSTVEEALEKLGHNVIRVKLSEAVIDGEPDEEELDVIAEKLSDRGFELIRNRSDELVEEIKSQLINYLELLEKEDNPPKVSEYISRQLHHNYSYISNHFSKATGSTIEQYLIQLKIERVKELLTYEEHTLSEIAWMLNYSSVQYLSNQFKNITGETVSSFRKHMDEAGRQPLDAV